MSMTHAAAGIGDLIRTIKGERTFQALAQELGQNINTLKFYYYRPYVRREGPRRDHESRHSRPDYAAIIGAVVHELAESRGVTDGQYRRFLRTRLGEREFRVECVKRNIPVFTCRYQAEKENGC